LLGSLGCAECACQREDGKGDQENYDLAELYAEIEFEEREDYAGTALDGYPIKGGEAEAVDEAEDDGDDVGEGAKTKGERGGRTGSAGGAGGAGG